ncbi:alcohol dehydrogenase catalytic domain-containing protein [Phytoactinopolyspora halotolerans]|uniref:Alcohol dehydrogenase catalytic domain-containing protein n=1 Tax=Phytoactinopolyspora halotolerans TaxID=1981512 RepID=A0A6L9S6K3_9ACTN|nr:alcohol dehydrogenase catalytic domain-containing protein [Phytoactinopolyspora halotolerans]NEE00709.1 alcohol dehydrogenase catalytic domain-containing protein [Phytoactinopolyspora halotolerans]
MAERRAGRAAQTTVRSLRFRAPGGFEVVDETAARLGPTDVRIAPLAVGVCGTDAHIVAGAFAAEDGVVLGHEICGRVVQRGAEVTSVGVGDLVTVEPHRYCTACHYCRAGREHLCGEKRGYGVRLDGGMTERMVLPARIAYGLPAGTLPWIGALCEPVACCVHGLDRLGITSGEALLVHGCGPAGAIMVALGSLLGAAPIVVMDPRAERRELAKRMGADAALNPRDTSSSQAAVALTGGIGFPAVVDAVGKAAVLESSLPMAARGGRILVFGVAEPGDVAAISPHELFQRELTLLGSVINPYTHQRAVALLPRLNLERLTPAFFDLDEFGAALDAQRAGVVDKVFVAPQGQAAATGASEGSRRPYPDAARR